MNDASLYEVFPALEKNYPVKFALHAFQDNGCMAHWHEQIEVWFFTAGGLSMYCGSEFCEARENDLIFVNRNELHYSVQNDASVFWCLHIYPAFFKDIYYENVLIENVIRQDPYIIELFQNMIRETEEKKEGYDMALKSYTYAFVTYVLRNYKKSQTQLGKYKESEARIKQLGIIFDYISQHYTERISTAGLAEMLFLNEEYFCRLFKNATGQSVMNYINSLRVEKATVLLENTSETITAVAARVGFNDPNYFTRTFKRFMNVSPGEYRRTLKDS